MTKQKWKIIILAMALLVVVVSYYGIYEYRNNKIYFMKDCNEIKKAINAACGGEYVSKVTYHPGNEGASLSICVKDYGSESVIYRMAKVYDYVRSALLDENQQIERWRCGWWIFTQPDTLALSGISIEMDNENWGNQRPMHGIYMILGGDYGEGDYEDVLFPEVKYLRVEGFERGLPAGDLCFAQHFPDVQYVRLTERNTTREELDYLQSVLPEDCIIDDYVLIDSLEAEIQCKKGHPSKL